MLLHVSCSCACKRTWWDSFSNWVFVLRNSLSAEAVEIIKHDENRRVACGKKTTVFLGFSPLFNVYIVTYDKFDERVPTQHVNRKWLDWFAMVLLTFSMRLNWDLTILRKILTDLKLDFWSNASRKITSHEDETQKCVKIESRRERIFYEKIMIYGSTLAWKRLLLSNVLTRIYLVKSIKFWVSR